MKSNNIILVQFRTDKSILHEQKCVFRDTGIVKKQFKIIDAFDSCIDFSNPKKILGSANKVILGGSGEFSFSEASKNKISRKRFYKMINKITPFIQHLLKKDIYTLGICFGHQLLGYNLGVRIIANKNQKEIGSFTIFLTRKGKIDSLFSNLPHKFIAQCAHKDSLKNLPKKSILLAKSKQCKIQSFRYKKNIYGIQFHPELTIQDMIFRAKLYPNFNSEKKLIKLIKELKSSPFSMQIMKNFRNF